MLLPVSAWLPSPATDPILCDSPSFLARKEVNAMNYSITSIDDSVACDAVDDVIVGVSLGIAVGSLFFC